MFEARVLAILLGTSLLLSSPVIAHPYTDNADAEKYYKQGTTLMQKEYYKQAVPYLVAATQYDHHFVASFINLALCYNKLKQYKEALNAANSALQWNSESSYAWFHKANAEQSLGKYLDAANDYQTAAKFEPEAGYKYLEQAAKCYELAGQLDKAKEVKLQLSQSTDPNVYLGKGVEEYDHGQFSESIKEFTAAIDKDPKFVRGYYNRGLSEATLGQYKQALIDYNKVLELDPKYLQGFYIRGMDKFFLGDYTGAIQDLRYHVTNNDMGESHSPYSVLVAALAYRKVKQPGDAHNLLDWWEHVQGDETKWPMPLIKFLAGQNSAANVLAAAKTNDLMTEAKTYIGLDYSLNGKTKEAINYLTWVKQNGNKSFSEYQMALTELNRLNKLNSRK